jgi:hypothetical protein
MNQSGWISLVMSLLFSALFILAIVWLIRGAKRRWRDNESRSLHYHKSIAVLGAILVIFFFGIAIFSNTVGKNATTTIWTTATFVGFGALCLPFIAEFLFSRHRVTKEGLDYGGMFGKRGFMTWESVQRVSIRPWTGWFLLESSSGKKARISLMLEGLTHFANMVLEHVPGERIAPEAFQFLMLKVVGLHGNFIDPDSIEWQNAVSKAHST